MSQESTPSDKNGDNPMTLVTVTVFDDDDATDYKWSEVRDRLSLTSNVANARWMPEKLLPLFRNLKAPDLLTDKGRPTRFGAQMLARYKAFCVDQAGDYESFCELVRKHFGDGVGGGAKAVQVEVLGFGDGVGDGGDGTLSPFSAQQQEIDDKADDLLGKMVRARQAKQEADAAIAKLDGMNQKSWEQEVIEDELAKFEEEQRRKKAEAELRLKVRQMLEGNGGGE